MITKSRRRSFGVVMQRLATSIAMIAALVALPLTARTLISLDGAARKAMLETGARGLAIATINNGKVTSVKAFGDRNEDNAALTPDTVMYGASLTKAVVGYLTVQLAAEGKFNLDRPIATMLAEPLPSYGNLRPYGNWGDLAADERWRVITPRMILTHSTGFANFAFLEPDRRLKIHFDPGTRYAYSGEGIMLLQFGLEKGLGLDLEAELQRRFFKPLGMTRTSLKWQDHFANDVANGWDADGKPQPHDERSRVRAAGSMDTTISDMARMAAAMVRGHGLKSTSKADFAAGTLTITTKQQFPTLLPDAPASERPAAAAALGVIAFNGPQGAGWYKGGHDDITANTLVCVERKKRCVLILSNDVRIEPAFPALVRAALGETGVPYRWEYPGLARY
jgi:CubicO group peptidase (beta-lactamase class C family)